MTPDRLSFIFSALADPTRRAILERLAFGECSVTELAEPFRMSRPAVSKHLKVLERTGLIVRGREVWKLRLIGASSCNRHSAFIDLK
ncbi:MAG TPA: metalloregulator ArsR/SmtB family transcription factor [Candidatus Baltobacteraceae bacterium]|jgi:DNA-binding transcriptional ArsR family regulator|nr:metalloregulator ArsR/SmtB family transcription factor [Candidatus Baltobacteraceae bacterium]